MPETKPLLVVNPAAGGGRCGRSFPEVRAVVERRTGPVDVAFTERPGHAIELARSAATAGRARVVAVGGDGTLNEVANGVLASERSADVRVGFVGQGTGGDFRRSLGIAHRLDAYVDALASGRERALDVGSARFRGHDGTSQRRWFLNILSVGMSGLVDRFVADSPRFLGGKAAYYLASVRALARSERARLVCQVGLGAASRAAEVDSYLLAVCNGGYFGGGMHVAPMAAPDDGRFEVVSIDAPGKLAFPAYMRKIYDGGHLRLPGVSHFACDRIGVELAAGRASEAFLLDVDGEPLGGLPLEIELVSKALRFLA
ncbi:MAG: diacylglycerol/lipid kinase family protein [Polyangiaceae bacterium]